MADAELGMRVDEVTEPLRLGGIINDPWESKTRIEVYELKICLVVLSGLLSKKLA